LANEDAGKMPALQNAAKTPRRCRQDAGATDAALKTEGNGHTRYE
jgi:hypothetical protein